MLKLAKDPSPFTYANCLIFTNQCPTSSFNLQEDGEEEGNENLEGDGLARVQYAHKTTLQVQFVVTVIFWALSTPNSSLLSIHVRTDNLGTR